MSFVYRTQKFVYSASLSHARSNKNPTQTVPLIRIIVRLCEAYAWQDASSERTTTIMVPSGFTAATFLREWHPALFSLRLQRYTGRLACHLVFPQPSSTFLPTGRATRRRSASDMQVMRCQNGAVCARPQLLVTLVAPRHSCSCACTDRFGTHVVGSLAGSIACCPDCSLLPISHKCEIVRSRHSCRLICQACRE